MIIFDDFFGAIRLPKVTLKELTSFWVSASFNDLLSQVFNLFFFFLVKKRKKVQLEQTL